MRLSVSLQGDLCFTGTDGKDAPQPQSLGMTRFLSGRDRGTDVSRLPGLQALCSSLAGAVAAEGAPGLVRHGPGIEVKGDIVEKAEKSWGEAWGRNHTLKTQMVMDPGQAQEGKLPSGLFSGNTRAATTCDPEYLPKLGGISHRLSIFFSLSVLEDIAETPKMYTVSKSRLRYH